LTFGKKEEQIFLGREIATHRDYSEHTAQEIDKEVRRIVEEAEQKATELLGASLDKLHLLANALLEREILDGEQIDKILRGEKLEPPKMEAKEKPKESIPSNPEPSHRSEPSGSKTEPGQNESFRTGPQDKSVPFGPEPSGRRHGESVQDESVASDEQKKS
jgi:cell division protease FtsH